MKREGMCTVCHKYDELAIDSLYLKICISCERVEEPDDGD